MSDDLQFPPPPETADPTAIHLYGCLRIIDLKQDLAAKRVGSLEGRVEKVERRSGSDRRGPIIKVGVAGTGFGAFVAWLWHLFAGSPPSGHP